MGPEYANFFFWSVLQQSTGNLQIFGSVLVIRHCIHPKGYLYLSVPGDDYMKVAVESKKWWLSDVMLSFLTLAAHNLHNPEAMLYSSPFVVEGCYRCSGEA